MYLERSLQNVTRETWTVLQISYVTKCLSFKVDERRRYGMLPYVNIAVYVNSRNISAEAEDRLALG